MFAAFMLHAWVAAGIVGAVAGAVGFFVVLRGQAFAAHAIPNGAFAGAAAAMLESVNALIGLGVFALAGALGIAAFGRRAGRDVATALVLVLMLALGALLLGFGSDYAPEVYALLFGEVLGVSAGQLAATAALAGGVLAGLALLYRPLLLCAALPESPRLRPSGRRALEPGFLIVVALATTMTVPIVGATLMFSLMIGPAAAACSLSGRPSVALGLSVGLALAVAWSGVALAYLSGWPVGFYVGMLAACVYLAGRVTGAAARSRRTMSAP
jgi:zinc/manganese transport system permease protein